MRNWPRHRGVFAAHRPRLDGRKEPGAGFHPPSSPQGPGRRSDPCAAAQPELPPCPSPPGPGTALTSAAAITHGPGPPASLPTGRARRCPEPETNTSGGRCPSAAPAGADTGPSGLFFTFVSLGDLRHFVQRQRRRGGTGSAPPLPPHGAATAGTAQARPPLRGPRARPRPSLD